MGKEAAAVSKPVAALSTQMGTNSVAVLQMGCSYGIILYMGAWTVSFLFPLGFLVLIRNIDLYATGKFRYNIIALFWGMFAFVMAGIIHTSIISGGSISQGQVARSIAPVTEELLKALILFYLVSRSDFNYVVDGAIYGFSVGIGFAMWENYQYVFNAQEAGIYLALVRFCSTNLIHASTSGLVGSALAASRLKGSLSGTMLTAFSLVGAIGWHMGFNRMVVAGSSLILALLAGFFSIGLIAVIIRVNLNVERKWIMETLGMGDRVTTGEAAIVHRIEAIDDVLAPIYRQFGPDKACKTVLLLHMQAEIGIKRKLARLTSDKKTRAIIEAEIKRIAAEMDCTRKAIGPYCMLYVRGVYLARGNKQWDLIDQRVAEAGSGPAGGGVWSALENRIKEEKSKGTNNER